MALLWSSPSPSWLPGYLPAAGFIVFGVFFALRRSLQETFLAHFSSGSRSRFDIVYWHFFLFFFSLPHRYCVYVCVCVCVFAVVRSALEMIAATADSCSDMGVSQWRMCVFASLLLWNRSFRLIPNFLSDWYVVSLSFYLSIFLSFLRLG